MQAYRGFLTWSLSLSLCFTLPLYGGGKPLGVLALAYGARLNTADAFAGLSVFAGELMTTEEEGKAMVRIGGSTVTLAERTSATLEASSDGAHVDLIEGAVFLSSAPKNPLEAHAEDALVRPHSDQNTKAQVLIYSPKVLQITARAGSLDFTYHGEFRVLPEGQTYRIYLESEAEPQSPAGAGSGNDGKQAEKPGTSRATKVAYFIVDGAGLGVAVWGIHDIIESHDSVESPAKP